MDGEIIEGIMKYFEKNKLNEGKISKAIWFDSKARATEKALEFYTRLDDSRAY